MKILTPRCFKGASGEGPHVLITAGVHGNEVCGPTAVGRLFEQLGNGEVQIARGQVTFVQVCNPRAFEANKRFHDRNLNRRLYPRENPKAYEDHIANELCQIMDGTDYLLDLHSYSLGGAPFASVSREQTAEEIQILQWIRAPHAIFDFAEAYKTVDMALDPLEGMGTREYHLSQGGLGTSFECGGHTDPESVDVAYHAILNLLEGLGVAEISTTIQRRPPLQERPVIVQVTHVIYKDRAGHFCQDWQNFAPVTQGMPLAKYENGDVLISPIDGVMVMPDPRPETPPGEEWYYLGQMVS